MTTELEQKLVSADALLERAHSIALILAEEAQACEGQDASGYWIDMIHDTVEEASELCSHIEEWRKGNPHAWQEDVCAMLKDDPQDGSVDVRGYIDTLIKIREARQKDQAEIRRLSTIISDASAALAMVDNEGSLADRINALRALWVAEHASKP